MVRSPERGESVGHEEKKEYSGLREGETIISGGGKQETNQLKPASSKGTPSGERESTQEFCQL